MKLQTERPRGRITLHVPRESDPERSLAVVLTFDAADKADVMAFARRLRRNRLTL